MASSRFPFRFESDELREKIEARAADKGLSLNEWLNRAAKAGLTAGGTLTITTTVTQEF